jgi:hypothetical protein
VTVANAKAPNNRTYGFAEVLGGELRHIRQARQAKDGLAATPESDVLSSGSKEGQEATVENVKNPTSGTVPFARVLRDELSQIRTARGKKNIPAETPEGKVPPDAKEAPPDYDAAYESRLLGLSFSGGGIRSATLCLGMLQGLSRKLILPRVDYLSTVSGGGYMGSWLASWIRHTSEATGDPATAVSSVERELLKQSFSRRDEGRPTRKAWSEPREISHLRQYSNYLTPRLGMFSADTWSMAAIWSRNTLLNLLILVAAFASALLIPRLLGFLTYIQPGSDPQPHWLSFPGSGLAGWVAAIVLIPPTVFIGLNLLELTTDLALLRKDIAKKVSQSSISLLVVIICAVASSFLISGWLGANSDRLSARGLIASIEIPWLVFSVLFLLQQSLGGVIQRLWLRRHPVNLCWSIPLFFAIPAICGFVTCALLYAIALALAAGLAEQAELPWRFLVWGPPAVMLALTIGVIVQIGLIGHDLLDAAREWLGRLRACMMMASAVWIILFGGSLYGPYWIALAGAYFTKTSIAAAGTWLATTIGGLFAAKSPKTSGRPKESAQGTTFSALDLLARVGPWVFAAGFILIIAFGVHVLVTHDGCWTQTTTTPAQSGQVEAGSNPKCACCCVAGNKDAPYFKALAWMKDHYWSQLGWPPPVEGGTTPLTWKWPWRWNVEGRWWVSALWHLFAICLAVTLLLSWRVDINDFSLNHFYKNRLVRCYLGASNPLRRPNPFTGFDEKDDEQLPSFSAYAPTPYYGPYPIINTTLNVSSGGNLAWQERKGSSYVFTPLYSGYDNEGANQKERLMTDESQTNDAPAYRRTEQAAYDGITLGTAVAISGAAANPNSGFHTSTAVAFLMTVFDVRLGWWVGNPKYLWMARKSGPPFGLMYTFRELFGLTTANSWFVDLSDGGHFENMGIYELVRRRCRYIICCDGEQDGDYTFGGLAGAIRKCRTDFGTEIDIDLHRIIPKKGFSAVHCAVGRIYYPERKPGEYGYLLYMKSSLTNDEPSDVLEYHASFPQFPHQTTGDQWFDESQFESYRRLGLHIADTTLASAAVKIKDIDNLFQELEQIWYPSPPEVAKTASERANRYAALFTSVGKDDNLEFLDPDVLPNWTGLPTGQGQPSASAQRSGRYQYETMLRFMEQVFYDLNLENKLIWNDPHIAGLLDIFRHWKRRPAFDDVFSITRPTYSPRFQAFYDNLDRS